MVLVILIVLPFGKNIKMISVPLPLTMRGKEKEGMEELFQTWNSNHTPSVTKQGLWNKK